VASMVAETVTHPIDFVKTRKQVLKTNVSALVIARDTFKTQGIGAFYPAIAPAILRHWVYSTLRVALYERFRQTNSSFWGKVVASLSAGGISQAIASPTDLVKVVMQTNTIGGAKKYNGIRDVVTQTYQKEGFWGFYRGWKPNVIRAMAVNLGELVAYDVGKQYCLKYTQDGLLVHVIASLYSGFWATFCSCPADVLKSRLMAGEYTSMTGCLVDTLKKEGFFAMWKGFMPNWIRLGPWQLVFWVVYEQGRQAVGTKTFA